MTTSRSDRGDVMAVCCRECHFPILGRRGPPELWAPRGEWISGPCYVCQLIKELDEAKEIAKESDINKPIWDRLDSLAEKQGELFDKLLAEARLQATKRAEVAEKHSAELCVDLVAATDARDAAHSMVRRLVHFMERYQYRRAYGALSCVECDKSVDDSCGPGCIFAATLADAKELVK